MFKGLEVVLVFSMFESLLFYIYINYNVYYETVDIQLLLIREGLLNSALQMKSVTEKVTITRRRISGDKVVEK
jgi:hypothetical protein